MLYDDNLKGFIRMKRVLVSAVLFCILINAGCSKNQPEDSRIVTHSHKEKGDIVMKQNLLCLMLAYPENIIGVECDENGWVYVAMKSGKRILYDDKRTKTYDEKMETPDLQDMMEQGYPLYDIDNLLDKGNDPGRVRVYAMLKEVYGESRKQIEANLVTVRFGYKNCRFNSSNKAAESLKKAGVELTELINKHKSVSAFIYPVGGTYSYRLISGTNRLSAHSFGTAVDLSVSKYDYWKWASREQGQKRLDSYPKEIVRVFENNGFIWGGKWGHFDIMHYEYRPELIFKSRYFAGKPLSDECWFKGIETEDADIKNYIQLIDKALK